MYGKVPVEVVTSDPFKAFKRNGCSTSTKPHIRTKKSETDIYERASARVIEIFGSSEIAAMQKQQFLDPENNRQPMGCIHDVMMDLSFS